LIFSVGLYRETGFWREGLVLAASFIGDADEVVRVSEGFPFFVQEKIQNNVRRDPRNP